jgi:protein-S-isoprenylcysteine O-methyltransferase Ste14
MTVRAKSYLLVSVQFLCLAALALTGPLVARHPALLLVEALGGLLGVWAVAAMGLGNFRVVPDVKPTGHMVHSGPYARIRHPMYTALILVAAALVFDQLTWPRLAILALLAGDLVVKLRYEEGLLLGHFPEYAAYSQRTRRLIPFVY